MLTIRELLPSVKEVLDRGGISPIQLEAEKLLAYALNTTRIGLYCDFDKPLAEAEVVKLRSAVRRRLAKEPFAYIEGIAPFYGLELEVNRSVLIPRMETELLVQDALRLCLEGKRVLDLCTGTGAIAIAIKKNRPDLAVTASDISEEALSVAKRNCESYGVDVRSVLGDFAIPFLGEKFDLVVCNPPYISEEEWLEVDDEVRLWEPKLALVSGPKGLEYYERMISELPPILEPGSYVLCEMGYRQAPALHALFANSPFDIMKTIVDYQGIPRHLVLKFKENFRIL